MRVAVTDACIFIDLYDLKIFPHFFALELEVHTSIDVFNELYPEQQQLLQVYQSVGKLTLHTISENDRNKIITEGFPKSLSMVDQTVLYLARTLNAMLLSGDKAVRQYGKKIAIEYHGMLWIFDQLVASKVIQPGQAAGKLKELLSLNPYYQYSDELVKEVFARIKIWEK
ncbi:MAG: hypothetical protein JST32_05415 [Bacteroidetes bacterium]|nr:hypothetical protein [Bacteroidota bacterium]